MIRNLSSPYYLLNSKSCNRKGEIFLAEPETENMITVWSLLDETSAKHMLKMIMPSVKFCEKIYVPNNFFR